MDQWVQFPGLKLVDEDGNKPPQEEIKVGQAHAGDKSDGVVNFLEEAGHESNEGMDEESLREHETVTKVKNIEMIELVYICETRIYGESKTGSGIKVLFKTGLPYIKAVITCRINRYGNKR